jgi:ribosomal protein L37AE/L43A
MMTEEEEEDKQGLQVEMKQGEWIPIEVSSYHCKKCGEVLTHRLPRYWKCYKCRIWFSKDDLKKNSGG